MRLFLFEHEGDWSRPNQSSEKTPSEDDKRERRKKRARLVCSWPLTSSSADSRHRHRVTDRPRPCRGDARGVPFERLFVHSDGSPTTRRAKHSKWSRSTRSLGGRTNRRSLVPAVPLRPPPPQRQYAASFPSGAFGVAELTRDSLPAPTQIRTHRPSRALRTSSPSSTSPRSTTPTSDPTSPSPLPPRVKVPPRPEEEEEGARGKGRSAKPRAEEGGSAWGSRLAE